MANLWKQGVQENKDLWSKGSASDKVGAIGGAVSAAGSITSSAFNLAKGNKSALTSIQNEANAANQQMIGSDSLDSIYNTAVNYNPMSTHHKWQEFFDKGGQLSHYDSYFTMPSDGYTYGAGGKIAAAGLSNTANGAMAGFKVGGPWGAVVGGAVGLLGTAGGALFGHSKAKKMAAQANAAAQQANEGMQYKINSAIEDNSHSTLQDYENAMPYAYGGYLGDMGAVNYGLANDYLTIKNKEASNKQTPVSYLGNSYSKQKPTVFDDSNSFANGGGINIKKSHEGLFTKQAKENGMDVQEFANHVLANKDKYPASTVRRANFARNVNNWNNSKSTTKRYALGGDMQSNGGDFSDGLTEVNAGGTHEENPNGGVPMGVAPDNQPNLVEEGETIYNDYVYSNRIKPDKEALKKFHIYGSGGKMTYADLSKKLEKESKERPNDPISKDGLNAQLSKLAQEQERQKAEEEQKRAEAAFEALSPQEKEAVLQELAQQQEAQAMQEQQAQQQAEGQEVQEAQGTPEGIQEQQMSPEEQEAMQQQQAMEQQQAIDANAGNANESYAKGGELHKFDEGGPKVPFPYEYTIEGTTFNNIFSNDEVAKSKLFKHSNFPNKGFLDYNKNMPEEEVKKLEATEDYQRWTDYVLNHWNDPVIRNYLQGLNTIHSVPHLFEVDKDGKIGKELQGAKDYFKKARTDGKMGWYHLTPEMVKTTPDPSVLKIPTDAFAPKVPKNIKVPNIHVNVPVSTATDNNGNKPLPTWPRKVGLFGPLAGLAMQGLGIGKNPGKDAYNAALSAINGAGNPYPTHIGDYIRYTPFDLWQSQNKADSARLSTNRAIMNNNAPIGAKITGLVANANNFYQGNGNLVRQAQEYNNKNMVDVATFNRGTNQFNAQADNQFALAANQNRQWRAQTLMNYAAQKAAQDQQWYSDIYDNVNNLFKGISDYGRENMAMNQVNANAVRGVFGNTGNNALQGSLGGNRYMNAKGGKINKKKRRGYTF